MVATGVVFAGAVGAAIYFTLAPGKTLTSVPTPTPSTGTAVNPTSLPPETAATPYKVYENKKLGFSVALSSEDSFATDERNAVMFSAGAKAPWHFSVDAVGKGIYEYHVPVYEDTEAWLAAQPQTPPAVDVPSIQFLQRVYSEDGNKFAVYAQYVALETDAAGKTTFGRQVAATFAGNGRIYTITVRATYPETGAITLEPAFLDLISSFKLLVN